MAKPPDHNENSETAEDSEAALDRQDQETINEILSGEGMPGQETTDAETAAHDALDSAEDGSDAAEIAEHEDTADNKTDAAALATAPLASDGTPEPEPELEEHEADTHAEGDEHEEEHSRSLAARVLTWLLLILAGGGLALWGAPQVAPNLPDGLGPVKAWLLPGEFESRRRIAEVESSVETRLADITSGMDEAAVRDLIATQLAALQDSTTTQIQELSDQVAAADSASVEGRLAQFETRLEGVAAELGGLQGLSLEGGGAVDVSGVTATVDGLRAELAALAQQQGALSQRIDDVEVEVARRLTEAEAEVASATEEAAVTKSSALAEAAVSMIDAAIASGEPFDTALVQLTENTDAEVPEALVSAAAPGVATLGVLRNSFSDAAHDAIRADIKAQGSENVGSRLTSFLEAQIATRSLTPQEGDSTDAVLSRAEDALRRDNLAAAVAELEALPEAAKDAMGSWTSRAQARVDAVAGLAQIRGALN